MSEPLQPISLETLRIYLKLIALDIKSHKDVLSLQEQSSKEDRGEVIANMMLAYRHVEDATMRLGKVYQAQDGGESCYTK